MNTYYTPRMTYMGIFDNAWENILRPDTPFNKFDRVYISFGQIVQTNDGHFTVSIDGDPSRVTQIVKQAKQMNPNIELFLTTGGDSSATSYGGASSDPSFASNVLTILDQFGLQGFDIDWEMGLDPTLLASLLTNMAQTFQPKNTKLTLDVWPFSTPAYNYPLMAKTLNQLNIMSYGPGCPIEPSSAPFLNGGIPPSQLVAGTEVEYDYSGGNPDSQGPVGSIAAKCAFAQKKRFGGVMSWRLDNDMVPPGSTSPSYSGSTALCDNLDAFQTYPKLLKTILKITEQSQFVINQAKVIEARQLAKAKRVSH